MKVLFTAAFMLVAALCLAQAQNVYFLKNNGRYVQVRDSADYIRVVREPDSASVLYNVFEYYPNGITKLAGKSSVIDPPKFEGHCITYYINGKRKSVLNYKGGFLTDDAYEFYPSGKPYMVKKYPDQVDINNHLQDDYQVIAEYDSLGTALITDGSGYYKEYDDHFKNVIDEGTIANGKRTGPWKGADEGLGIHFAETYENGSLISGFSVGEKGDTVKYSRSREVEPQYKGGLKAFYNFIGRNVQYPDYERANNIEGKVILTFVIEKNGQISDVKIVKNVSYNIDKEALRVLNLSRNWIPGTEYGRNVRVAYTIPISFALN